jgi:hypothetical protein
MTQYLNFKKPAAYFPCAAVAALRWMSAARCVGKQINARKQRGRANSSKLADWTTRRAAPTKTAKLSFKEASSQSAARLAYPPEGGPK